MKEDKKVTIKNLPSFTLAQASSIAEKEKTRLNPPSEEDLKVKERFKNHWKDYQQSAKEHTEAIKKTRRV